MSNRGRHKKLKSKYPNTWLTNVMTDAQLDLLFKRANEQGNSINTALIERDPVSTRIIFWSDTPEGWEYWNDILHVVNEYKSINRL